MCDQEWLITGPREGIKRLISCLIFPSRVLFFFYDFRVVFCVIFDSEDLLYLFTKFFMDLLVLDVAHLWLMFHLDSLSSE